MPEIDFPPPRRFRVSFCQLDVLSAGPLPQWFRIAALANPITWEVDLFRYSTIGLGAPKRLMLESIAFALFALASFVCAVRSLRGQG